MFNYTIFNELLEVARQVQTDFNNLNIRLDTIMTSLENLTQQVTKNSADIDAALEALKSSGATPAQLDALTKAIADKDALIETALNMPPPALAPAP